MNDLVGERISIITSKAQTTRHRILGIVNRPEYQIVFSDTPGVLKPKYKMQEGMLAFSEGALTDADIEQQMQHNIDQLNTELPAYSRISRMRILHEEFEKTPKRSIKRYLYQH